MFRYIVLLSVLTMFIMFTSLVNAHYTGYPHNPGKGAANWEIPHPKKFKSPCDNANKNTDGIESDRLSRFLKEKNVTIGFTITALFTAFVLGSAHALSPGHGKALVAAYLIGSKGRIRDAVTLGGIVTMSHMSSVILLGIGTFFLSRYIVPEKLGPWIGIFSGMLIFFIGYWMLAKRAMASIAHGHTHAHHDHGHHAGGYTHTVPDNISFRNILSLGIAGGIVPCPSALAVLLVAISMQRIGLGLLLIAAFSVGLAVILTLIGILTVTASGIVSKFSEKQRWIQYMPVFSAGVIMIVGVLITFQALIASGITLSNPFNL